MVLALFSLLSFGLFPTSYLLLRKIQHFDIEYSVVLVCMQFLNGFYFYRIYSKWDIPLCEKLDSEELMLCYTMLGSIKQERQYLEVVQSKSWRETRRGSWYSKYMVKSRLSQFTATSVVLFTALTEFFFLHYHQGL